MCVGSTVCARDVAVLATTVFMLSKMYCARGGSFSIMA
jgi:hypothetical protein